MLTTRSFAAAAALSALVFGACASASGGASAGQDAATIAAADPRASASDAVPPKAGVLAAFVGQPLVIVPIQQLRVVPGAPTWAPQAGEGHAYMLALEEEIAAALTDRGVTRGWVLPAQVERSARRNPTFASDPRALAIATLLPTAKRAASEVDPRLATQLRALTALSEDARYALVPVEVRFERAPSDAAAGRIVLHLAIIDTRLSRVSWTGDVASDAATSLSPALAASLADRVAALAAPPPR